MTKGKDNYIDYRTAIEGNVRIGDNNHIGPYCIIGDYAEWRGKEEGSQGNVVIGNNNRITGAVTIDGGVDGLTVVHHHCYLMKGCHLGHNVVLWNNVTVACGAKIGGHCIIHDGVNIGLNAVIHQHKEIPEGCMIGMGAVVTKTLEMKPYGLYVGNPAKYIGDNIKHPNYKK